MGWSKWGATTRSAPSLSVLANLIRAVDGRIPESIDEVNYLGENDLTFGARDGFRRSQYCCPVPVVGVHIVSAILL